ncbi:hypothetical protein [Streptomyces sioyaensis]|uniref:hypothetical protein n=1 Tax=Streptomyces sioyaensis TaxID=67364 RepID=UPI00371C4C12
MSHTNIITGGTAHGLVIQAGNIGTPLQIDEHGKLAGFSDAEEQESQDKARIAARGRRFFPSELNELAGLLSRLARLDPDSAALANAWAEDLRVD